MSDSEATTEIVDLLDLPIESLGAMTTRLRIALTDPLRGNGFRTVRELVGCTRRHIERTPSVGKKLMAELDTLLDKHGLEYAPEEARRFKTPGLPFPSVHDRLTRIEQRLEILERSLAIHEQHGILRAVGDMSGHPNVGEVP